jgi:hypothetical protein
MGVDISPQTEIKIPSPLRNSVVIGHFLYGEALGIV